MARPQRGSSTAAATPTAAAPAGGTGWQLDAAAPPPELTAMFQRQVAELARATPPTPAARPFAAPPSPWAPVPPVLPPGLPPRWIPSWHREGFDRTRAEAESDTFV